MNDFSTNKTGFIQADTQYTVTVDNTGFIHDLYVPINTIQGFLFFNSLKQSVDTLLGQFENKVFFIFKVG